MGKPRQVTTPLSVARVRLKTPQPAALSAVAEGGVISSTVSRPRHGGTPCPSSSPCNLPTHHLLSSSLPLRALSTLQATPDTP